jgi:hypothetical protein
LRKLIDGDRKRNVADEKGRDERSRIHTDGKMRDGDSMMIE